jgi:bifunctional NMN adenylyltransferase/nudix hydrolase
MLGSIKGRMVCDLPYRSVRGRTISHAFHFDLGNGLKLPKVMARDDAKKAEWIPFHEIKREEMFEDHYGILDSFLNIG